MSRNPARKSTLSPLVKPSSVASNGKRGKKDTCLCPICDEEIVEATAKRRGDESIECEGRCAAWLHRRCAGLSKAALMEASESEDPFFCPNCRLANQALRYVI